MLDHPQPGPQGRSRSLPHSDPGPGPAASGYRPRPAPCRFAEAMANCPTEPAEHRDGVAPADLRHAGAGPPGRKDVRQLMRSTTTRRFCRPNSGGGGLPFPGAQPGRRQDRRRRSGRVLTECGLVCDRMRRVAAALPRAREGIRHIPSTVPRSRALRARPPQPTSTAGASTKTIMAGLQIMAHLAGKTRKPAVGPGKPTTPKMRPMATATPRPALMTRACHLGMSGRA